MLLKEVVDKMTGLTEVELNTLIDFAFLRKFSLQEKRERSVCGYKFQFTEKYKEGAVHIPHIKKIRYDKTKNIMNGELIHNDIVAKTDDLIVVTLSFFLKPGEVIERQMVRYYRDLDPEVLHVYYTVDRKGNLILISHNEDQKNFNRMIKYLKGEITLDNLLEG